MPTLQDPIPHPGADERAPCAACRTPLPHGASICFACKTLQSAKVKCPTCFALIPKDARKCTSCDSFFDWRRWSTVVPVVVGMVAVLSFGVPLGLRILQRNSFTEARIVGSDPEALLVGVVNSGYASSLVRRDFTLRMADEKQAHLIAFGELTLSLQNEQRLLSPNESAILKLGIASIQSPCDLDTEAFWKEHGNTEVILKGFAEESNGKRRHLEHSVPLSEIKAVIQWRKDPVPTKGKC